MRNTTGKRVAARADPAGARRSDGPRAGADKPDTTNARQAGPGGGIFSHAQKMHRYTKNGLTLFETRA
jgi:hypothetical protein